MRTIQTLIYGVLLAACGDDGAPGDADTTWRDPSTGLTWEVRAHYPELNQADGRAHCAALRFAGHDDWRMPDIDELRSLIRGCATTESSGACEESVACPGAGTDCYDGEACMGCFDGAGPGVDGCFWPPEMGAACDWTWSSTPAEDPPGYSCFAHFGNAHLSHDDDRGDLSHHVVCVRSEP